ncbi:MAG: hypothetical protein ACK53L_31420, partial [Pirellulaceae bacterium]
MRHQLKGGTHRQQGPHHSSETSKDATTHVRVEHVSKKIVDRKSHAAGEGHLGDSARRIRALLQAAIVEDV